MVATDKRVEDSVTSNLLIRASAGTGKTYRLTNRYLQLLFSGTEVDEILATTFTRKAAGEILARVLLRLAEAAHDATCRAELAEALDLDGLDEPTCRTQLRRLVRQLHRVRIATLDSFFVNLASGFEFELGLPPNWAICDPIDEAPLRNRALGRMLIGRESDADRWMYLLAKGAAKRGVHALLMDTVEQAHGIYCETPPEVWQKLPRTEPLSDDALQAARQALRALELPAHKSLRAAHEKACAAADVGDWKTFGEAGITKKLSAGETTYYKQSLEGPIAAAYRPLVEHVKALLIGQLVWQTEAAYSLLQRFDEMYRALQWEAGRVRFSDIPPALVHLMSQLHDDRLAYRLGGRIHHLLLDEFQDTSLVQWRALEPISRRIAAAQAPGQSLFCVGDTKQAIYGWRGGMVEIFDHLEKQLPNLRQESLVRSYRSSRPVIDMVNRVFLGLGKHNNLESLQRGVDKWARSFEEHQTAREDLPGYACVRVTPESDDSKDAALEETIQLIRRLRQATPHYEIAVLTRANARIGELIYRLRRAGIPASEEGGNPLTDSAAVQVILSALRLADHPGDTVSQFHLAHSPLASAIGWTIDAVGNTAQAAGFGQRLRRQLLHAGYGVVLGAWANEMREACTEREWQRLQQLVELAYRYDRRATLRTTDFVNLVCEQRVADPTSAPVRVMTVHQSKGLEFDIVLFPEMDASISRTNRGFAVAWDTKTLEPTHVARTASRDVQAMLPPSIQRVYEQAVDREVYESLCVLYVALTRAKHALYMIVSPRTPNKQGKMVHLKTYAGLVQAALVGTEPLQPDTIAYEIGDETEFLGTVAAGATIAEAPRIAMPTGAGDAARIVLAPPSGVYNRGLETVAPSSLEGGEALQLGDLLDPARQRALRRGTLIHAWFESIEWLDEAVPERAALQRVAQQLGWPADEELDHWIDDFLRLVTRPDVRPLFEGSSYTEPDRCPWSAGVTSVIVNKHPQWHVTNESRVACRDGERVLAGNIDRLVWGQAGGRIVAADIIDFKTDRLNGDGLDQRVAHYRPQLLAYRRAVSRMLELPPERIAARLLFVETGQLIAIA